MGNEHHYSVTITWTGNLGTGTSGYRDYSRDFLLEAEGLAPIDGSSDRTFRGDAARWNPEQMLLAALSACHKLSFLHLAADAGIVVTEYIDRATGTMRTEPGGHSGRFTEVVLHPVVTVASAVDEEHVRLLHEHAHRNCFIANSVNFPVRCEGTVHTTEAAEQPEEVAVGR